MAVQSKTILKGGLHLAVMANERAGVRDARHLHGAGRSHKVVAKLLNRAMGDQ